MQIAVLGVILFSSLCWSLFDASRKKLAADLSPWQAVLWLTALQIPLFAIGAGYEEWSWPNSSYWLAGFGSIAVNLIANVLFVEAVKLAPLSLAVPILSLTPVFATLGAALLLQEPIELNQVLGIGVIVAGTLGLSRSGSKTDIAIQDQKRVRLGLLLMTSVAALFASAAVFDKLGVNSVPLSLHGFILSVGITLILTVICLLKDKSLGIPAAQRDSKWLLLAGVTNATALVAQLWAIKLVPVGIFEALKRSFGLGAALILGLLLFREPITRSKVGFVIVIAIGVVVLLMLS